MRLVTSPETLSAASCRVRFPGRHHPSPRRTLSVSTGGGAPWTLTPQVSYGRAFTGNAARRPLAAAVMAVVLSGMGFDDAFFKRGKLQLRRKRYHSFLKTHGCMINYAVSVYPSSGPYVARTGRPVGFGWHPGRGAGQPDV